MSDIGRLAELEIKLRQNATPAELKFKSYLDGLNIKYYFQKGLRCGNRARIVDFYVPSASIAFEIDGPYHKEKYQKLSDDEREDEIMAKYKSIVFIRFSNEDVMNKPKKVKSILLQVLRPGHPSAWDP